MEIDTMVNRAFENNDTEIIVIIYLLFIIKLSSNIYLMVFIYILYILLFLNQRFSYCYIEFNI